MLLHTKNSVFVDADVSLGVHTACYMCKGRQRKRKSFGSRRRSTGRVMNCTSNNSDREQLAGTTDDVWWRQQYDDDEEEDKLLMDGDLLDAIELLRSVATHDDSQVLHERVPLRPSVNRRFQSLPPALPRLPDHSQLHVRHCSSLNDDPLHSAAGALAASHTDTHTTRLMAVTVTLCSDLR